LALDLDTPTQESTPLLSATDQNPVVRPKDVALLLQPQESSEFSVDLPTFLIQRACANSALANYFYWSVSNSKLLIQGKTLNFQRKQSHVTM
jgi:hypothetical protein